MSPGDRPSLALSTEPLPFLRAEHVGRPVPGPVQPVDHRLALEEEPALRPHLDVRAGGRAPREEVRDRATPMRPRRPPLPTTGTPLPVPLALTALGMSWVLRRRSTPPA